MDSEGQACQAKHGSLQEQQRQENIELVERCASQEEQVSKLTSKLEKLWDKCPGKLVGWENQRLHSTNIGGSATHIGDFRYDFSDLR